MTDELRKNGIEKPGGKGLNTPHQEKGCASNIHNLKIRDSIFVERVIMRVLAFFICNLLQNSILRNFETFSTYFCTEIEA